jgi:hypothetical protein
MVMCSKGRLGLAGFILLLLCLSSAALAQGWPLHNAQWEIVIQKDINTVPPPHEPFDLPWMHMHRGHPTLPDALSNTLAPIIVNGDTQLDPFNSGIQIRYLVKNIPVSGWLDPPFRFELQIDNPALGQLQDGVHDLSVDVRGATRADFKPRRGFVHLSRDLSTGEPFGFTRDVPIVNSRQSVTNAEPHFGPGVVYVNPDERKQVGYPLNPDVTPWQLPPVEASLYQELMGPHTELFHAVQMWWDHIAHPNAPYIRGMTPQHGEDHRFLRVDKKHERFPMTDGPRGIGWMSPYVSGQVDSQGRFAFAEAGGRIGYMLPDGEIITVAGWRVHPDKDPLWWEKPTEQVRQNMQLRGNWQEGRGEFFTPLDIAIDPQDESIWYVVSYEDHVVWKVELPNDLYTQEAIVSVFAGDPAHSTGSADGNGQDARFNGPSSIVFDPVNDVLYVADQDNDAIRQITRSGEVSTLFGQPGMRQRIESRGVDGLDQVNSRSVSTFEVSQAQAGQGVRPDIYLPQVIRVDSKGRLILLEIGYGAIRRIDPLTGVTETLGEVQQKHRAFDRGWAWLDVDRYGNAGPLDGIYWCKFVSTLPGELFNEVFSWLPPDGGESVPLFPRGTGLYPDGWGERGATNSPHYPWLVAVDPRGALLMTGGGEHGVTRLRIKKEDDPIQGPDYWLGRRVWKSGSDADGSYAANSFALKYGYGGHNYLGLNNAWGLSGASDEQLLDAYAAPDALRNDPVSRQQWLDFIKPNTHNNGGLPVEQPTDPLDPTDPGEDDLPPLVLGSVDKNRYGFRFQGINSHRVVLERQFEASGADLLLSLTGFDIDTNKEIRVFVNDNFIGTVLRTPNNGFGATKLLIAEELLDSEGNTLRFVQQSPGGIWGVTDLLLTEIDDASDLPALVLDSVDTTRYGFRFRGVNSHVEVLERQFDASGTDLLLTLTGYDIDTNDEVSVYVNGSKIGTLNITPNNDVRTTRLIISQRLLRDNGNTLRFVQKTPGWVWGVTGLLLSASDGAL